MKILLILAIILFATNLYAEQIQFKFNADALTISDFYLNLGNQLGLSQKQITNLSQQKIAAGFTAPTQNGGTTGFWNTREDYVKAYQADAHPFGHGLYGAEQSSRTWKCYRCSSNS